MTSLDSLIREQTATPPKPRESRDGDSVTTPNGTQITFHEKPHRHYKINGKRVASVTQVLDCIDKPALKWWGMKVGVLGVQALVRDKHLDVLAVDTAELDAVVNLLTTHKLTVNHVRREAADRGLRVHDALEAWAKTGLLPDPAQFVEEERGYVQGLIRFITETGVIPDGIEVMVGSVKYQFAGRCDLLRAIVPSRVEVPVHIDPKTGAVTLGFIPAGRYLFDLKTSAGVYDEALLQVEGYEGASIECGYQPTEFRAVVRVSVDGDYEIVRSVATYGDFLAARQLFGALRRLKEARTA